MKKLHLLVLSIGSLLGQNILDALEGRRASIKVTGLNSVAGNPRLFRCDTAYLVPPVESPDFEARLLDILRAEDPDVILPGRDADILVLARLRHRYPEWHRKIPMGSISAAEIMNDKLRSFDFALEYGLPFAPTIPVSRGRADVETFVSTHGFPLIAKPSDGFGSLGITILTKPCHVEELLQKHNTKTVLQPLMGVSPSNLKAIEDFERIPAAGVPFFFHLPDEMQYASQTMIGPDGVVGTPFCSLSTMILGRCEKSQVVVDREFEDVSIRYARAMAQEGWIGMFNLQCRKTPHGYVAIEMNGRMSGSTSARTFLGYDEVRLFFERFYGFDLGDIRGPCGPDGIVYRVLTNTYVPNSDVGALEEKGRWSAGQASDRIVLTGATGYIGRALLETLHGRGLPITVLTNDPAEVGRWGLGVEVVSARNYGTIPWHRVSTLVHLGFARPHHGQGALNSSMEYSAGLLDHAARAGVQSIIFISSRSVYGTDAALPVDETTPANPDSPYGMAKWAVELMLGGLGSRYPRLGISIVRLGAVNGAGAGSVDVSAISKFVKAAAAGEQIVIEGGHQTTDVVDVRDVAEALSLLVACPPDERMDMYVVASPCAYSISEIAAKCVGLSKNPQIKPVSTPSRNKPSYAMDPSRFMSQFHWKPRYSLDDIIISLSQVL